MPISLSQVSAGHALFPVVQGVLPFLISQDSPAAYLSFVNLLCASSHHHCAACKAGHKLNDRRFGSASLV